MVKRLLSFLISLTILCSLMACSSNPSSSSDDVLKIGIAQIVEHPALDSAREGFIDELRENGYEDGKNIKLYIQNAQGEPANLNTIAKQFDSKNLDMVFAIATNTAQAMANTIKDKPILITAVTDPVDCKLVKSMDNPGGNITGTSDLTPVKEQMEIIHNTFPSARKIGMLYNAGEANSLIQVDLAKKSAKELGLEIIEATVTNSSEVNQAAQSLVGRVDIIYTPTDNTVASSINAVAKVAMDNKIPHIGAEKAHVEGGALFTKGIDYYDLGRQTGKMAIDILKGSKPGNMSIQMSDKLTIAVNQKTLRSLGIELPDEIMNDAEILR